MARLSWNDGMYCGEVADIIQPLFPIGMKIPKSIRLPPDGAYDDCVFFRGLYGRNAGYPAPPVQSRTCSFPASGSSVVLASAVQSQAFRQTLSDVELL